MPYQSPLHILHDLGIPPQELDGDGIVRIRKKLLADFNLHNTTTIEINGISYSKDDVLKTIDMLKDIENLEEHILIFKDEKLLAWLEQPTENSFPLNSLVKYLDRDVSIFILEFRNKVITDALVSCLRYYIKAQQFETPIEILQTLKFFNEQGKHEIIMAISNCIEDLIEWITNITERDLLISANIIDFLSIDTWSSFLNELPKELDYERDDVCNALINLTVLAQYNYRQVAYKISCQLVKINCDGYLKELIVENHKIYSSFNTISRKVAEVLIPGLIIFIIHLFLFWFFDWMK